MNLGHWMEAHDLTDKQMGDRLGVSDESVRLYRLGKRRPRDAVVRKIIEATAGKVTASDFYGVSEAAA